MPHHLSTNSLAAIRLWGRSGTRKDFLASSGIFYISNSRVSVVIIDPLLGAPIVFLGSYTSALLYTTFRPTRETDAADSKKVVFLFIFGGLVQTGGSSSSQIFMVLFTMFYFPASSHRHFPLGGFPNTALNFLPPMVFWSVASFLWSGLSLALRQFPLSWPFLNF